MRGKAEVREKERTYGANRGADARVQPAAHAGDEEDSAHLKDYSFAAVAPPVSGSKIDSGDGGCPLPAAQKKEGL